MGRGSLDRLVIAFLFFLGEQMLMEKEEDEGLRMKTRIEEAKLRETEIETEKETRKKNRRCF